MNKSLARQPGTKSNPYSVWDNLAHDRALANPHQRVPAQTEAPWPQWLQTHFPGAVKAGFAPRHHEFWDWVWSIEPGLRPRPFIALWPRGGGKSTSIELAVIAIGLRGKRRYCLYICDTQDRANEHLLTIANKLEAAGINRRLNKYGASQGWRRNRLRTHNFTIDALGLDVAARGKKLDDDRPDLICLDDIDREHDTAATTAQKTATLTKSILPARANGCAVLFAQNLIHRDSIATALSNLAPDGRADFLTDRQVSGPFPAIEDLQVQLQYDPSLGANRHLITGGTPTWPGQDLKACQEAIDTEGLNAFLTESQHQVFETGGALFHRDWFEIVESVPHDARRVRRWDEAATEAGGDFTVGTLMARAGNTYFVEDLVRFQHNPTRRDELILQTAQNDAHRYGAGTVTQIGVQDPGSAGIDRSRAFRQLLAQYPTITERETGDKVLRADGLSRAAGSHNVKLLRAPWNDTFLRELERFPHGDFDDIVDATSGAYNRLAKRRDLNSAIA